MQKRLPYTFYVLVVFAFRYQFSFSLSTRYTGSFFVFFFVQSVTALISLYHLVLRAVVGTTSSTNPPKASPFQIGSGWNFV